MTIFRDPSDVWDEGIEDCINGLHDHGSNIRKAWADRLTPKQRLLLEEFQQELINRLKVTVFPETRSHE